MRKATFILLTVLVELVIISLGCWILFVEFPYEGSQEEIQQLEKILEGEEIKKDTTPPVITLNGDFIIHVDSIDMYEELGAVAFDFEDNASVEVEVSSPVFSEVFWDELIDGKLTGADIVYKVSYKATDEAGNVSSASREIYCPAKGLVCLTFDDGPSKLTNEVLDILKEKNVRATFFVLGDLKEEWKAEIVRRINMEGHTLGLHGMSHEYSEIYHSPETAIANFVVEEQKIGIILGEDYSPSRFIRFPGGASNTISKKYCKNVITDSAEQLTELGYTYIDWNVDSNDAGADAKYADAIYSNVVTGVIPGKTNVVLMHDASTHLATVEALPQIIDALLGNGYVLVPINNLTPLVQHNIQN